jgi:hypothetical protein
VAEASAGIASIDARARLEAMVSTELISRANGVPRAGLPRPDLVTQDVTAAAEAAATFLTALGVPGCRAAEPERLTRRTRAAARV